MRVKNAKVESSLKSVIIYLCLFSSGNQHMLKFKPGTSEKNLPAGIEPALKVTTEGS